MQMDIDPTARASKSEDKPLDRYFRILEVVCAFPSGIGLAQVSEIVGLPKTTVHRLLRGLLESEVLETSPASPLLYIPGSRVRRLLYSSAGADWVEKLTRVVLGEVAEQTGQTCFVAKFEDLKIRSVAMVTPNDPASGYVVPGRQLAMHAAASAKAILAFQEPALVRRLLPYPLPRLTDKTITDTDALLAEFSRIRDGAFAVCNGEDYEGFGGLALPIHLPDVGVIFSVALTGGISSLLGERREEHQRTLALAAKRLTVAMSAGAEKA
ncbi:IclR family transcriptional regulator C-terminal domain-containing protein [Caballeronia sp. AZ10_KS36]|uniref:IclR family transcriptional regulator n=1 Tax=Caballeronia sp. AZ10_KS36 TaxID=2921757 RepID=UPI00202791EF|nr:IclR family transcriptional regulator C-terminal domain-containing protein [Caballeronia sp. AZ10_KS36]